MGRLIKQSQSFIQVTPEVIFLMQEILHMELTSSIRYKYYEYSTTGAFHDAIVPNFAHISEADADHSWELLMLLASYGVKSPLQPLQIDFYPTTLQFLNAMVEVKKNLIAKYVQLRDLLKPIDQGAVMVIETIMSEERINMSELLKLLDQSSLIGL